MPEKAQELQQLGPWRRFLDDCVERDPALEPMLCRVAELEITEPDRELARRLLTELSTRITATDLRYRDGDESAALDSLYQVFVNARESIVQSGDEARAFSALTVVFLERMLRPFTGYWHGRKLAGALERQDERRKFRRQLPRLREQLDSFRSLLVEVSDRHEIALPDSSRAMRSFDTEPLWPDRLLGPAPRGTPEDAHLSLAAELEQVEVRRQLAYSTGPLRQFGGLGESDGRSLGLMGLALSGGGIRSSTFCLGVVQTLARYGVLRDFDYLSTVSGGGYLGSFLSSRLHRRARDPKTSYDEVLAQILTRPEGRTGDSLPVRWLRNNSKYLLDRDGKELRRTVFHIVRGLFPGFPSLHSLYRDRLARGYLHEDYEESKPIPLVSDLVESPAPYHLINSAVNLPASKDPELRGRRSDFFVISPLRTGSVVTGYCATRKLERYMARGRVRFDLASAMAISGAAVSSHMGMRRSGALVRCLLVAANVRLGYWLPNPREIAARDSPSLFSFRGSRWRELRGDFDEGDDYVNLSDGGHVENLGLYELLRRRCKFIVVVDGECDPARRSGSLVKATQLAKIDLGVEINIDVSDLRMDESERSQTHWAFGTIDYNPRGESPESGYLLYLKLSITGNEPDYVTEYRRRCPAFPHQSTADQIFDEDQFEAYRALGEHVAQDVFGIDIVPDEELKPRDAFRSRRWLEGLVHEFL